MTAGYRERVDLAVVLKPRFRKRMGLRPSRTVFDQPACRLGRAVGQARFGKPRIESFFDRPVGRVEIAHPDGFGNVDETERRHNTGRRTDSQEVLGHRPHVIQRYSGEIDLPGDLG